MIYWPSIFANAWKVEALYALKRHEEALAAYEQAINLDPNDAFGR